MPNLLTRTTMEEQEIKMVRVEMEFEVPAGMGTTAEMEEWVRFVICNSGHIKKPNWYLENPNEVELVSVVAQEW